MRIRGRLVGGLAMAAVCLPGGTALAAPGDLDPSFGNGGKLVIPLGSPNDGVSEIALQGNAKIVAIATIAGTGGSDFGLIRTNPQGTLDQSFGSGGLARVNLGGADTGAALTVGPDDKVYAAGTVQLSMPSRARFGLARLDSGGGLDTTFAPPSGFMFDRFEPLSTSSGDVGFDVSLQPDGKVLVAGRSDDSGGVLDFAVARVLNPEGILDSSFGGDGGTTVSFGSNNHDLAVDVEAQPDGRIVLGGFSNGNGVLVARLTPEGAPDGSFGNGSGQVLLPGTQTGGAFAIQPDGKLIVAANDGADAVVARLLPNGSLDTPFSNDGRTAIDFGATDFGADVALQQDGKIVLAGRASTGAQGDYGVARLQPNGSPDTTFGNGGVARIDVAPADIGNSLALQPDGKVVVGGFSGASTDPFPAGDISMIRLQGDPPGNVAGKCRGKEATILGTNGKNKLKGTKKKDVISAGGGADTVKGLKGNDLICGGRDPTS